MVTDSDPELILSIQRMKQKDREIQWSQSSWLDIITQWPTVYSLKQMKKVMKHTFKKS